MKINKNCLHCNKLFETYKENKKYCSNICANKSGARAINGKHFKKETIEKMKASMKGRKPWNKGIKKCYSEKTLEKIKEWSRNRNWKGKTYEEIFGEERAKEIKKNCSKAAKNRKIINTRISKSETLFLDTIENLFNVKIERQFKLNNKLYDGKFNNILIEVDNPYWHSFDSRKLNDEYKEQLAECNNFILKRFNIKSINDVDNYIKNNFENLQEIFKNE